MKKIFSIAVNYAIIIFGVLAAALAVTLFLSPNRLAGGGISGLAIVLHYITGFPIGVIAIAFNIPLFLLGMRNDGRAFAIKSIAATVLLSVFIDLFSGLPALTDDLLLASVFGGVMMGLGLGLVFVSDSTTGGTDIVAKLLQRIFRHIPIGRLLLFADVSVILFATVVFGDITIGLYSTISLYASTYMIDTIIDGGKFAKTVFVISNRHREIAAAINRDLKRGVTGLYGCGMYSGQDKVVLMCTVKRNQIPVLKDMVKKLDSSAFVILTDVREVLGEGFINNKGGNQFEQP